MLTSIGFSATVNFIVLCLSSGRSTQTFLTYCTVLIDPIIYTNVRSSEETVPVAREHVSAINQQVAGTQRETKTKNGTKWKTMSHDVSHEDD